MAKDLWPKEDTDDSSDDAIAGVRPLERYVSIFTPNAKWPDQVQSTNPDATTGRPAKPAAYLAQDASSVPSSRSLAEHPAVSFFNVFQPQWGSED